ncbi:MAG TPA: glycosyltransferase family 2 protein [Thermodesulfobacteriota bacterium]|nr:glycosyltransferase family 2 protein [Thermodesulfobacteriota bacterium]
MNAKIDALKNIKDSKDVTLSIIIVSWNTREYLLSCLESIFEEGDAKVWEVIVIDNRSADGSGCEAEKRFPEIHLIENEKNLGFAKATNQGLKRAAGKYVLLLNPDTRMKSGAVERLILFMNAFPKVGVAGVQLLNSDGSRQNSIANFPSLATELLNKSLLRWLFPKCFPGKEMDYPEPIEVDSVIGACMMVRREAMEQVGLLDEDYFLFLEETDWCYRMKRAGWKIYHVPQAGVYHFQGRSAEKDKKRARIEYYASRYHFFKKNKGNFQWFILLVGGFIRLGIELMTLTVACLFTSFAVKRWREKFSIYASLMGWHLRGCPQTMGLRNRG